MCNKPIYSVYTLYSYIYTLYTQTYFLYFLYAPCIFQQPQCWCEHSIQYVTQQAHYVYDVCSSYSNIGVQCVTSLVKPAYKPATTLGQAEAKKATNPAYINNVVYPKYNKLYKYSAYCCRILGFPKKKHNIVFRNEVVWSFSENSSKFGGGRRKRP